MDKVKYIGKCLFIEDEREKLLVIGDLHLGYEEALEGSGVFIGRGMFKEMISDLDFIFSKVGRVDFVVLLGDLKHDFSMLTKQEKEDLNRIFDYFSERCKKVIIIKGNHDNFLKSISLKREIEVLNFWIKGNFCFLHGDKDFLEAYDKKIGYWIMGHIHPAVKISDGGKIEKYKCFLSGEYILHDDIKKVIILPSFPSFSEGSDPREDEAKLAWKFKLKNFEVRIIGENLETFDFGKLKDI